MSKKSKSVADKKNFQLMMEVDADRSIKMLMEQGFSKEQILEELAFEQKAREEGSARYLNRFVKSLERGKAVEAKPLAPLIETWAQTFHDLLVKDYQACDNGEKGNKPMWFTTLRDSFQNFGQEFDANVVVQVALPHLINRVFTRGKLHIDNSVAIIGSLIEADLRLSRITVVAEDTWNKVFDTALNKRVGRKYRVEYLRRAEQTLESEGILRGWKTWDTQNRREQVAWHLIKLFYSATGAFYFQKEYDEARQYSVYLCNLADEWKDRITENTEYLAGMEVISKPTLIPPKPWTSMNDGGYWLPGERRSSLVIRKAKNSGCAKRQRRVGVGPKVLRAINAIQNTPFKVNTDVLDLANQLYREVDNDGVAINLQTVSISSDFKVEREVAVKKWPCADFVFPPMVWEVGSEEHKKWKGLSRQEWEKDAEVRKTPRIVLKYLLDQANEMADYEKFYLPWQFDFRGRAYAVPMLNPQKDDLCKALLMPANGKPIGERGWYWLKFMVATLGEADSERWGSIDKAPPAERVKWCEQHRAEIEAIAYTPLDCLEMWAKGDNRFQFYAGCRELVKAWQLGEGNEKNLVSGFPIAFDGSCSGIQHYSAMTRDENAGYLVNLTNAERQDLYQFVADKVVVDLKQIRYDRDATKYKVINAHKNPSKKEVPEHTVPYSSMADSWLGYGVNRKLIKTNVMTYAYSSKHKGMTDQIIVKIKERFEDGDDHEINQSRNAYANFLATYSRKHTKEAAGRGTMVMDWLKSVVGALAQEGLHPEHLVGKSPEEVIKINAEILQAKIAYDKQKAAYKVAKKAWDELEGEDKPAAPMKPEKKSFALPNGGNQCLHWTTPDGFPVWQMTMIREYRRVKFRNLAEPTGLLREFNGAHSKIEETRSYFLTPTYVLDTEKNGNAIAPDFIHSMDACHLRMTVNACVDEDVNDFILVHDSFGTIPADADKLYRIVREQFVKLYTEEESMLDQIDKFAKDNLPAKAYARLTKPTLGNLDVSEVLNSTYAFI